MNNRPPWDAAGANLLERRSSGLLLHMTSLPGRHGSGDLSDAAFRFVDFLAAAGQSWWQMLPVGPPGEPPGNSPYSSCSSVAGSPFLVSLETLWHEGWLADDEVFPDQRFRTERVCFSVVRPYREKRLRKAWGRFQSAPKAWRERFADYCVEQQNWLDPFALFCALRQRFHGAPWPAWPSELRWREPAVLAAARSALADEFSFHRWVQFQFHRQWTALRGHARRQGVALMGDLPICVAHNSADVWAQPELFKLDRRGQPTHVSGYPPDAFCRAGQRWGHPQYRWQAHRESRFGWWIARFKGVYRLFDAVRLDHFLGFTRLWSIPARARTARSGHWVATPGRDLLGAVRRSLGAKAMIAEDLGHVTPADVALRQAFGIPAMRILQWGLGGGDPQHRPHAYTPQTVAYTGTHDTNTTAGWFRGLPNRAQQEVLDYAACDRRTVHFGLIRAAMHSSATTVIVPVQDLLGLDDRARLNRPGKPTGNWHWRLPAAALTTALAQQLRRTTRSSDRLSGNDSK